MPAIRLSDFDTWRPGYGGATVRVLRAGTDTLASIFLNEALTTAAANPQTLLEKTENGISYGKWSQPIYTGEAVELQINNIDTTGVIRPPITDLAAQSVAKSVVQIEGGSQSVELEDHLARRIDVRDYGEFVAVGGPGASAATNTATLVAALGVAGAAGGGFVEVPAGTYAINSLTIPQGCVLRGAGRVATTLQSTLASNVVTLGGARSGLERITIDGVSQAGSSVGLYSLANDETVLNDVEVKRFETGLNIRGGQRASWDGLFVSDCVNGADLRGDLDAAGGSGGEAFRENEWHRGKVDLCSAFGVRLQYVDAACIYNVIESVGFENNTGDAVQIVGARSTSFNDCWWVGNTTNVDVDDGSPATTENTVISLLIDHGRMNGGTLELTGNLEDVLIRRMDIEDVDITITTPSHNVICQDCTEDSLVTLAGVTTAWLRADTIQKGASAGLTTAAALTKAWAITLEPGQRVYAEVKAVGRQRNGTGDAFYHEGVYARRPGASLDYDTQTANFTVGNVLTGQTSGATARITADSDAGATGTLTLQDVVGEFVDDEIITDGAGGSATANGALSFSDVALVGSVVQIRTSVESNVNWSSNFVANGPQLEYQVGGDAGETVEWTIDAEVVTT